MSKGLEAEREPSEPNIYELLEWSKQFVEFSSEQRAYLLDVGQHGGGKQVLEIFMGIFRNHKNQQETPETFGQTKKALEEELVPNINKFIRKS